MKISAILGVPPESPFRLVRSFGLYKIQEIDGQEYLMYHRGEQTTALWDFVDGGTYSLILHLAPKGIILENQLNKLGEQYNELKACARLGWRWLVKNHDGALRCFTERPIKKAFYWAPAPKGEQSSATLPIDSLLYPLAQWGDGAPVDILKEIEEQSKDLRLHGTVGAHTKFDEGT